MRFSGISKTFSTINNEQYKTISAFWDELSEKIWNGKFKRIRL